MLTRTAVALAVAHMTARQSLHGSCYAPTTAAPGLFEGLGDHHSSKQWTERCAVAEAVSACMRAGNLAVFLTEVCIKIDPLVILSVWVCAVDVCARCCLAGLATPALLGPQV